MNKNILAFVHSLLHTFSKLETLDCNFDCDCKIK